MKNNELQEYLQNQIAQSTTKLKNLSHDAQGNPLFKRSVFQTLEQYALSFIQHKSDPRIIVMPGLRGVGKTTLLAQLFLSLPRENVTYLYLSVEEALTRFNVNLWDIIENYEKLLNIHLEELKAPLILFLDEVHYDKKWALFLKTIYDRSKNVMIFCSGSAALLLREQINTDVARRVFFVDIQPVSFSEYLLLKHKKQQLESIQPIIANALFASKEASEIHHQLIQKENQFKNYWLDIDKFEIDRYLKFGTFPFTLNLPNETFSLNFIEQIINKVIYSDIPQFYNFSIETLNQINKILYLIASTLGVKVTKLSETLGMKTDTLRLILKSLEAAGLIFRIAPYGSHFNQIKKPSKYLFATPSLRFSYLSSKESISLFDNYKGSLLEDIVGMYLHKMLTPFNDYSLTYDMAEGGADFVINLKGEKIVLEVGMGSKNYKQVLETSKKIKSKYNLIISNDELEYSKENKTVKIPLKYFLLG